MPLNLIQQVCQLGLFFPVSFEAISRFVQRVLSLALKIGSSSIEFIMVLQKLLRLVLQRLLPLPDSQPVHFGQI